MVIDHTNRVTGLKGFFVRTCMEILLGKNTGHDNKLTTLTKSGLEIATNTVANATSFFALATKHFD